MSGHVDEFINEPNTKRIWLTLFGILFALIITVYFGTLYYRASATDVEGIEEARGSIGSELQQLRAYEAEMAGTTKWIDKEHGIVQIPIDTAIDLVVASYHK